MTELLVGGQIVASDSQGRGIRPCATTLRRARSILLSAVCGVVMPAAVVAQSYETGGIQLTFGTALGFVATDNEGPKPVGGKSSMDVLVTPSFGLLTQTPTSSFDLDAASDIRYGTDSTDVGLTAPRLSTRYTHDSADAALDLSASLRQTDLGQEKAAIRDAAGLTDFVNGTATRQATAAEARLNWGQTARVGYGLTARLNETTYSSGVASGLNGNSLSDNSRLTLGATTQLDMTKVLQLNGGLSYSRFDEDAMPGTSETVYVSTGVSVDRPLGPVTTTLGMTDTDAGQRYGLSIGRSFALPMGPVSGEIGATHIANGDTVMTGKLSTLRTLATGEIGFDVSRDVSSLNEQDSARLTTRMVLNYTQALSQRADLQIGFDVAQAKDIESDAQSFDASLGAVYSRPLTREWTADVGYSYRYVDDTPGQMAQSNTAFVSLRRKFVTRY